MPQAQSQLRDRSRFLRALLAAAVIAICLLLPTPLAAAQTSSFTPPAPQGQPSADVANTRYTTRLFGSTPDEVAVSVTRHTFTAAMPVSDPKTKDAHPDRPWSVILVTQFAGNGKPSRCTQWQYLSATTLR